MTLGRNDDVDKKVGKITDTVGNSKLTFFGYAFRTNNNILTQVLKFRGKPKSTKKAAEDLKLREKREQKVWNRKTHL